MTIDEAKEVIKGYGLDFDAVPESAKIERRFRTALRIAVDCLEEVGWYHSQDLIDRPTLLGKMDARYEEKVRIVPDNLAEGFMQMEKLIKQIPKAESPHHIGEVTEMVGDCETCKHYDEDWFDCDSCYSRYDEMPSFYEPYIPKENE